MNKNTMRRSGNINFFSLLGSFNFSKKEKREKWIMHILREKGNSFQVFKMTFFDILSDFIEDKHIKKAQHRSQLKEIDG